ncbi:signal peptide peptidase family protein [Sodiomyces alkalinus F11]|uniref:Signal peptide peptidase family protein n=1 Tax=Sodiomyces alkalinus (strain CBS 110278 / VKM F-3762 / F11) TaxID=1314773 RepID=A0A3N2PK81_SODAK|nr:signal peptide peptidase family protein [Sodiomyces alkalinus F11]ROT34726.1 signal peptide peptidase family protein [Sodiomyces alkalinus F11]
MASPEPTPASPLFDEVRIDIDDTISGDHTSSATINPIWGDPGLLLMHARIILTSLAIIYTGAHASLKRPASAAPARGGKSGSGKHKKKEEEEQQMHGLVLSDAILLPVFAGATLVGLYYLIQWLNDPELLNKILRVYLSFMGVASMTTLVADGIQLATSFVFPNYFRVRGALYHVDGVENRVVVLRPGGPTRQVSARAGGDREGSFHSPVPWRFGWLQGRKTAGFLWQLRHLLTEQWTVKLRLHGVIDEKLKVRFSHIVGFVAAVVMVATYNVTTSKMLGNIMGYAFCYGTLLLLSPTSFCIGSLVLAGLFVYDIVMVFYTPFMITVATKLDAPIKLTFDSGRRSSILGLGDIILPGLVMGLALRFDLWRYYQTRITYVETELVTESRDASSGDVMVTKDRGHVAKKAPYINATGNWADRFWVSSWPGMGSSPGDDAPEAVQVASFPKTYFYASVFGYTVGLLVTLAMVVMFQHGQPALFYLVPGVVGSLWLTAWARGEVDDMWKYTEDGSQDTEDVVVELDGRGNVVKELQRANDAEGKVKSNEEEEEEGEGGQKGARGVEKTLTERGTNGFLFSIRAPSPRGTGRTKREA